MSKSTTAIHRAIPELPTEVFKRLVQRLSLEDLRRFPAHRVPPGLSSDFADALPTAKREAITDLMIEAEADRLHGQVDVADRYGEPVANALHELEVGAEPRGLGLCVQRLDALESAAGQPLGVQLEASEAAGDALAVAYEQYSALARDLERLAEVQPLPEDAARFRAARERARTLLRPVDEVICRFYGLRLGYAGAEMSALRDRTGARQARLEKLDQQIEGLSQSLDQNQGFLRRLGRNREANQAREQQVSDLLQRRRLLVVPIDENQLTRWLDVVVESSLHPPSAERWRQVLRSVRVQLLQLLNLYCEQQEDSAREAAELPFAQVDARKVIEFSLRSESFILGYFANKKRQQGCWLTGAAVERLGRIDELQQDLLQELKRNQKRR